jgi:hypothetical protein
MVSGLTWFRGAWLKAIPSGEPGDIQSSSREKIGLTHSWLPLGLSRSIASIPPGFLMDFQRCRRGGGFLSEPFFLSLTGGLLICGGNPFSSLVGRLGLVGGFALSTANISRFVDDPLRRLPLQQGWVVLLGSETLEHGLFGGSRSIQPVG